MIVGSNRGRFESIVFPFHLLSETDNKEYLISIPKSDQSTEVYDFYSNIFYEKKVEYFFGVTDLFYYVGTHLKY